MASVFYCREERERDLFRILKMNEERRVAELDVLRSLRSGCTLMHSSEPVLC